MLTDIKAKNYKEPRHNISMIFMIVEYAKDKACQRRPCTPAAGLIVSSLQGITQRGFYKPALKKQVMFQLKKRGRENPFAQILQKHLNSPLATANSVFPHDWRGQPLPLHGIFREACVFEWPPPLTPSSPCPSTKDPPPIAI